MLALVIKLAGRLLALLYIAMVLVVCVDTRCRYVTDVTMCADKSDWVYDAMLILRPGSHWALPRGKFLAEDPAGNETRSTRHRRQGSRTSSPCLTFPLTRAQAKVRATNQRRRHAWRHNVGPVKTDGMAAIALPLEMWTPALRWLVNKHANNKSNGWRAWQRLYELGISWRVFIFIVIKVGSSLFMHMQLCWSASL